MPKPPDNRSAIDKIFDLADEALVPLEAAFGPVTDGPSGEVHAPQEQRRPANRQLIEAEGHWVGEHWWAPTTDGSWHCFPEASCTTECKKDFRSHEIYGRCKLEHGKSIVTCTSCIIAVSRKG